MTLETETSVSKKAQRNGSIHGHPMPLRLEESEFVTERDDNSKGKQLKRTSLYYPGCGDHNHDLAQLDPDNDGFYKPRVDDHNGESDGDWNDNEQELQLAIKNPSRFFEAVANERPSWMSGEGDITPSTPLTLGSEFETVDTHGNVGERASALSTPGSAMTSAPIAVSATTKAYTIDGSDSPPPANNTPAKCEAPTVKGCQDLHVDTNLVFMEGSTKLMLTHQRPVIQSIVQDAIDNIRASLLVRNAFPDAIVAFVFTKDALHKAAEQCDKPGATTVQARLQDDEEYMAKLVSLPRARISLIHSEVKDRCNAVSHATILGIGSVMEVARVIGNQLSHYTYTFPRVPPNFGAGGLVKRSLPYRNEWIIAFGHLFPVHFGDNGRPSREVPVPMVALIVTALYATLYEWRTGEQMTHGFSANSYMDVYAGHVNTLRHVMENRERAFHVMMSDIYTRANTTPGTPSAAAPIATLDLNTLDE
ncbi:hypothetical protein EI94DRAFT_1811888 [Lactarius quietus]|nr:hypothetical protein EI94DRAFT_1811888 [Lactarius quietus]